MFIYLKQSNLVLNVDPTLFKDIPFSYKVFIVMYSNEQSNKFTCYVDVSRHTNKKNLSEIYTWLNSFSMPAKTRVKTKKYLLSIIKINKIVHTIGVAVSRCLYLLWLFDNKSFVCLHHIIRNNIDKFSKHRPSGPMLSISRFVHMCVCVSVCLSVCSLLRYRLNVFLPPLPKVRCPKLLEIRYPWGKVVERSGLRFENFY